MLISPSTMPDLTELSAERFKFRTGDLPRHAARTAKALPVEADQTEDDGCQTSAGDRCASRCRPLKVYAPTTQLIPVPANFLEPAIGVQA
jgi:hypothetical protein